MIRLLLGACAVLACLAFWQWQRAGRWQDRAALEATEADHWAAEAATAQERLAQARAAAERADRAQAEAAARAAEYDQLRRALIEGDQDAPLPDWFRDYLASLGLR